MAFFRNTTVNLLNAHYAIYSVAATVGGAFFAIYLLKSGVSVPGVLASIALVLVGRFALRPFVTIIAARVGLRAMVGAGTLLSALQYPFLAEVHGPGPALALLIAISAIGETMYWTTYHAYFAALGDDELRGHQVGVREAIVTIVGIVTPPATGWLLVTFGPRVAFGTTAIIAACGVLPLLWTPEVKVARRVPGVFKEALPGVLIFVANGWLTAGYLFIWQLALFLSLGENILSYGGAVALAAIVGAITSLTLGRHIDAGRGHRAIWYMTGALSLILILRALATGNATLAVLANALGELGVSLYVPMTMAAVYTLAKRSSCTLRFHVATEGGWDVGGAGCLLVAALATWCGVPLSLCILLSLGGVAATHVMLQRYYAVVPASAAAE